MANKYIRKIQNVEDGFNTFINVDVYCVLDAYKVECPAVTHAIKKLLMPGGRGSKDYEQDLLESVQAIERAIGLHKGAQNNTSPSNSCGDRTAAMAFPPFDTSPRDSRESQGIPKECTRYAVSNTEIEINS